MFIHRGLPSQPRPPRLRRGQLRLSLKHAHVHACHQVLKCAMRLLDRNLPCLGSATTIWDPLTGSSSIHLIYLHFNHQIRRQIYHDVLHDLSAMNCHSSTSPGSSNNCRHIFHSLHLNLPFSPGNDIGISGYHSTGNNRFHGFTVSRQHALWIHGQCLRMQKER